MTTRGSLNENTLEELLRSLEPALAIHDRRYPGDHSNRQPVHTVAGGAHLFQHNISVKLGRVALNALDDYAATSKDFAEIVDLKDSALAATIYERVRTKLKREPIEDFRIDFEDGFGHRPDPEEDALAIQAAKETAVGIAAKSLPPFIGIRIKPLSRDLAPRALRTLDLYVSELSEITGGTLPDNFVITLPKVVRAEQVETLVNALEALEQKLGLEENALAIQIMVETPQSIISADGNSPLPQFVDAAKGRCTGVHFGVYDFTASTSITARHQRMQHTVCDLARNIMLVSLSETGVTLSDGATNLLPVPRHRTTAGKDLTSAQIRENQASMQRAWRLHFEDIQHSLMNGFYQGWDLHPAQFVTRYAAIYTFFLENLDSAAARLAQFVKGAARVTLTGQVFDDAPTGQALLNYFLRGLSCGALTEEEAEQTGLNIDQLKMRSFTQILAAQK